MIPPFLVTEVRRLLATGQFSFRQIAAITGVSRSTIGAISQGKRPDYKDLPLNGLDPTVPLAPPARCRGCGGKVYLPCRLCQTRATCRRGAV